MISLKDPLHKKNLIFGYLFDKGISVYHNEFNQVVVQYPNKKVVSPKTYNKKVIHKEVERIATYIYERN